MKKLIAMFMTMAMVVSLAACGGGNGGGASAPATDNKSTATDSTSETTEAAEDAIVLKFSDVHSPTAVNHEALKIWAEEVKAQTDGRIVIELYPSSQLGDVKPSMEAIQLNTLDMAISNCAVLGTVVPEFAVLAAPFMFETDDQVANALNGDLGDALGELAAKQNINIACYLPTGFRDVFSTKPVNGMEDLKGLKIRTMENPLDMGAFNAMGAMATPMAYGEVFTALQQKTIDAGENTLANIASDGFPEVADYVALTGHFYNVCPLLISNSALDKIPDDLKDTFKKACYDGAEKGRQYIMDANEKAIAQMEEAGMTVVEVDRAVMKEATAPLYDEFKDRLPEDLVKMAQSAAK